MLTECIQCGGLPLLIGYIFLKRMLHRKWKGGQLFLFNHTGTAMK